MQWALSGVDADCGQLFGHDEPKIRPREHSRGGEIERSAGSAQPLGRGLKQRLFIDEWDKLFWITLARKRPKPCSRAAAQNNRGNQ